MHDLTTVGGILTYLKGTRFAATKVYPLSGGNSAFIYRILLENPLPTGESVVVKHFEEYISGYNSTKLNVKRAMFEYEALSALASSGLFDANSTVQTPIPIHYDPETYTVFMTDLGSPIVLSQALEHALMEDYETGYALASEVGSALGDFVGRFHEWSGHHGQSALRRLFVDNLAAIQGGLGFHHYTMLCAAERFGLKQSWIKEIVEGEQTIAAVGDEPGFVLTMGDLWFSNILVLRVPESGELRIYIIDWEVARVTTPEFDIGELTACALSFGRTYYPQGDFPFIPALHKSYRKYRTLDPIRVATATGIDTLGFGTSRKWELDRGEEFLNTTALDGFELLQLAHDGDEQAIKRKTVVKELFAPQPLKTNLIHEKVPEKENGVYSMGQNCSQEFQFDTKTLITWEPAKIS